MDHRNILSGEFSRNILRDVVRSKFSQDVLWSITSLGILGLGGIIINLIITRFRGAEALGIFNQVYAIYIILSQIGVGGLQFSVLKHISHNQDDRDKCADITISALILVTTITVPICLIGGALAEPVGKLLKSPGVGQGLVLAMPGLLFFALNKVLINVVNGLSYMRAYAVFRSLRYILILLGIVAIIILQWPTPYLPLTLTISELLLFVGLIAFVSLRLFPLKVSPNIRHWFSEHIWFGTRGMLSGILIELNTRIDVLMLGYFSTDAIVGVYSFAAMLAEGLGQIPLAIRWNVDPIMGRYFAEGNKQKIEELSKRIRRVFYPIMGLIGATTVLLYPVFYNLFVSDGMTAISWTVFAIIMVGVVINAGYKPFAGTILQGGRPGAYTLFIVGLVVNDAILNLLFIPLLGIHGAAIVTMLTYILQAVFLVIFVRRLFGVRL